MKIKESFVKYKALFLFVVLSKGRLANHLAVKNYSLNDGLGANVPGSTICEGLAQ